MTINLEDGRKELFQWDTGRTLVIEDPSIEQVHFSNSRFATAIVVTVENGLATIPDELLQTPKQLHAWAFVGGGQCGYTKIERVFPVAPRNKPANYVYTPVKQDSLYELRKDLGNLDELETQSKDSMVAALNELRKEEDLLREMADGAVKTVNGAEPDEEGNVEITAGIQADWSQSDETAPDYIKNRPGGYISTVCEEPEEYSVTFATDTSGSPNGISGLIIERIPYVDIEIDGTKYENVPVNYDISDYYPYMGDPKLETYPFVIDYPVYWGAGTYAGYCYATEPGEKTVVITKKQVTTVKIPAELVDIPSAEMQKNISKAQTTADKGLEIAYGAKEDAMNLTGQYDWKQSNLPSAAYTIMYADGMWVAATTDAMYYSTDGITWEQGESPSGKYSSIGYGDGRWIAWSSNKTFCYSDDGKAWTLGTNVSNRSADEVVYGNGVWYGTSFGGLIYSANGGTYWLAAQGTVGENYFSSVTTVNGVWLAGSPQKGLWCSADGKTWSEAASDAGYLRDAAYANGTWVAACINGLYYSVDGTTWVASNITGDYNCTACGIAYADGLWVATTYGGACYSEDGMTWTESNWWNARDSTNKPPVYGDGIWVSQPKYSEDGKTWTNGYFLYTEYSRCDYAYYDNGVWMSSNLWTSVDGKAWVRCIPIKEYVNSNEKISYHKGVWLRYNEWSSDGVRYAVITPKYASYADVAKVASAAKEIILTSSTEGSTKRFHITVDDSGTLSATEITAEDDD